MDHERVRTGGVRRRVGRVVALAALTAGCGAAEAPPEPSERGFDAAARATVAAAVDSATWSFHAAEVALDGEAVVAHLATDFYMYGDGVRSDYADVAPQIRSTMGTLSVFDARWSDLEVRVLGPDAAIASFLFRDSMVTTTGDVTVLRGPTTLVWERRGDDWLIVYVDADHYPPD